MKKIASGIVKYRKIILLIATLLLIPSLWGAAHTRVNYDILSYLPGQTESMQAQAYLEKDFNLAGTAMILMDDASDQEVAQMKEQIAAVPGVDKTLWRDDVADINIPKEALPDALKDALYSGNTTMIIATFKEPGASDATMNAIEQIKSISNENTHVAGFSAIIADTKAMVDQETPIYSGIAVLLCLIVLCLGLKSWIAPLIFLLGIVYPIIYNAGTNYLLGQVSYITKALSMILLLAVSMDYSIFLLHRYQEEKSKNMSNEEAMTNAIVATFTSITSSSITTIAGFLALLVMQLTLGRDIGIVMAKGVILSVMSTIIILPSLLMFFDKWIEKWQHPVLIRPLNGESKWVARHYKGILIAFVCIFIPFIYFQANTNQYYDLAKSLPDSLTSVIGTNELKDKFDMNTTHFVMVDQNLSSQKTSEMVRDLEDLDGVSSVLAYEKFVGPSIPSSMEPAVIKDFLEANGKKLIMVNSSFRTATDEMTRQLNEIDEIIAKYDPEGLIGGEGSMTRDLITTTNIDFQMVNILSIVLIFIIIAITFKSFLLPVLLVLCIEFAISVNMGIPYLTHTTLPFIAGIVIGTIQLGACIDYAILMTSRFKEELMKGKSAKEAVITAIQKTSPSIITSGLSFFAACSGVTLIAKMDLIRSMCTLLGRGALISVVVILTVLPSMLLMFNKAIAKTTKGWPKPAEKADIAAEPEKASA